MTITCDETCAAPTRDAVAWNESWIAFVAHAGIVVRQGRLEFLVQAFVSRTQVGTEAGGTAVVQAHFGLPKSTSRDSTRPRATLPSPERDPLDRLRL